jgi:hypothetical protein
MEADENDTSDLDGLKEALRDELTRAAREEMARLRAEAAAGDVEAARVLRRLEKALARKRRTGLNPKRR